MTAPDARPQAACRRRLFHTWWNVARTTKFSNGISFPSHTSLQVVQIPGSLDTAVAVAELASTSHRLLVTCEVVTYPVRAPPRPPCTRFAHCPASARTGCLFWLENCAEFVQNMADVKGIRGYVTDTREYAANTRIDIHAPNSVCRVYASSRGNIKGYQSSHKYSQIRGLDIRRYADIRGHSHRFTVTYPRMVLVTSLLCIPARLR